MTVTALTVTPSERLALGWVWRARVGFAAIMATGRRLMASLSPTPPPRPEPPCATRFHAALVTATRLHEAAVARGDVQAQRWYALAVHALLIPSGVDFADWETDPIVELSEDRPVNLW